MKLTEQDRTRWADAATAATLFAVDPAGLGGVLLHALPGPVRERWLGLVHGLLPAGTPWRRVPLNINDGRLLGGLDLSATLSAGRPIAERGLLAEADGGVVVLAMAERVSTGMAARLAAALDDGELRIEREGLAQVVAARIGVIALDEGIEPDEVVAPALVDRFAFLVDLHDLRGIDEGLELPAPDTIAAARARLAQVQLPEALIEALCGTALALGIPGLRAVQQVARATRVIAALEGRDLATEEDASIAGRLVLAPRATQVPQREAPPEPPPDAEAPPEPPPEPPPEQPPEPDAPPEPPPEGEDSEKDNEPPPFDLEKAIEDMILEATKAAIPPNLLAQLQAGAAKTGKARASGKSGAVQKLAARGRPAGALRGEPRAGLRLSVIDTLRAAAPWQRLRQRELATRPPSPFPTPKVLVRREDFHVTRLQQKRETTTIFVVDASGSSAMNRLAEAKGAVELLLADCYVRRDRVAVIGFRGTTADVLLPPTRSLSRAKRSLAGLPGGGGTPLATALDAAIELADAVARRGETPGIVLLTDGRANVARDGTGGRAKAEDDAMAASRRLRAAGFATLFVDTSPRQQPVAQRLASEMRATYLPLPSADARTLSSAVRAVGPGSR